MKSRPYKVEKQMLDAAECNDSHDKACLVCATASRYFLVLTPDVGMLFDDVPHTLGVPTGRTLG